MKWIDLPPAWLLGALAVAWLWRWPAAWDGSVWIGVACLAGAAVLTVAAVPEFLRARTTIIPREAPAALITGGIFRLTRNPIYLADVLILSGVSLILGSVPGLILAPVLGWLLQERFIKDEEARLAEVFGSKFDDYRRRTRRWL